MTDDLDLETRDRLRRIMSEPASRVAVSSPWVERAREHTLAYKVYAGDTGAPVVRETTTDILRRTMPTTVGPDDAGMLTFGYSASYEDGQPRTTCACDAECDDCLDHWRDLGGEG